MRPTTKDLAKAAGVSLATVDRVLNERPNVSRKTVEKVNEAINRIGFVRNLAAVNLARNKMYRFRFLFPRTGDQYLNELLRHVTEIDGALSADMTVVDSVQMDMDDPHVVANYLGAVEPGEIDGIAIMAPESPQVRDSMARLQERGTRVVQFLTGQEKLEAHEFIGIDNFAAGATAGRIVGRFLGGRPGKVMVIAETMQSLDSIQRRLGFDKILNTSFPDLSALPSLETHGDEERTKRIISRTFKFQEDVVAVYVISSEARMPVTQIAKFRDLNDLTVVVHERTPFSEKSLRKEEIDAVIAQDPGHAVRSAVRIMKARSDKRAPLAAQEKIRIEVLLKDNL